MTAFRLFSVLLVFLSTLLLLVQSQSANFTVNSFLNGATPFSNGSSITEGQSIIIQITLSEESAALFDDDNISVSVTAGSGLDTDIRIESLPVQPFNINETVRNINVSAINDDLVEKNETFTLSFSANNASFEPPSFTFTVMSEDTLNVTISNTTTVAINRGEAFLVCAQLSSRNYTFDFSLIATANDSCKFDSLNATLSFSPPNTQMCVSFSTDDNGVPEGEESCSIQWELANGTPSVIRLNGPTDTPVSITPQVMLSIANDTMITKTESDTVQLCVESNRDIGASSVSLNFTITGDVNDITYQPSSRQLAFINGSRTSCLTIMITDDNVIETTDSVNISFHSPIGATFKGTDTITVNIQDNEAAQVEINSTISVMDNSNSFMICASFNQSSLTLDQSINLSLSASVINGTAHSGVDFSPISPSLISTVPGCGTVMLMGGRSVDGLKQFNISWSLSSPVNSVILATPLTVVNIIDTDSAIIGFTRSTFTVQETVLINHVILSITSGSISAPFNVSVTATDDTAKANSNFVLGNNYTNFMWPTGETSVPVYFAIIDNNVYQQNLEFSLMVGIIPSQGLGISVNTSMIKVTIINDDPSPSPIPSSTPSTPSTSTSIIAASSPTTTPTPTATTTPTTSSSFVLSTVALVGIIVGVVILGLLLLLLLVCVIACVKVKSNREGFYTTYEDKEEAPQMLRYSASLRSLQSQTVMPLDPREKENEYMV